MVLSCENLGFSKHDLTPKNHVSPNRFFFVYLRKMFWFQLCEQSIFQIIQCFFFRNATSMVLIVQTAISWLLESFPWNLVETFVVPRGWIQLTLVFLKFLSSATSRSSTRWIDTLFWHILDPPDDIFEWFWCFPYCLPVVPLLGLHLCFWIKGIDSSLMDFPWKYNTFGDFLTFHLAPSSGQNFYLPNTLVLEQIPAEIKVKPVLCVYH